MTLSVAASRGVKTEARRDDADVAVSVAPDAGAEGAVTEVELVATGFGCIVEVVVVETGVAVGADGAGAATSAGAGAGAVA